MEVSDLRETLTIHPHLEKIHVHHSMTILTIRTVKIHADHHPQLFLLKRRQGMQLVLQIHVLKVLAHKMDHVLREIVRLRVGIHLDSVLRVKVKAIGHHFHVPVTIVIMVLGLVHQVVAHNEVIHLQESLYSILSLTRILQHTRMPHTEQRNQNMERRSQKRLV
jgi:hypothetical protein